MKKYPLIGLSIVAVVVLILASLSNVVGFQTVQSSNQKVISDEIDQKDLLFQTIVDIANNKDIQSIIFKSQQNRERLFFNPNVRFSTFNTPVLTKHLLRQMYFIGLILSKVISKSRINSIVEKYQFGNQETQKEISAVIEKDTTLNTEISQLSNSDCDCENEMLTQWNFNLVCTLILFPLYGLARLMEIGYNIYLPVIVMLFIGSFFNCFWAYWPFMR